jgi:hypothetical protein
LATPFVENPNTRLVNGNFRVHTGAEYKSRLNDYKQWGGNNYEVTYGSVARIECTVIMTEKGLIRFILRPTIGDS